MIWVVTETEPGSFVCVHLVTEDKSKALNKINDLESDRIADWQYFGLFYGEMGKDLRRKRI